jgi:hypothetical protein
MKWKTWSVLIFLVLVSMAFEVQACDNATEQAFYFNTLNQNNSHKQLCAYQPNGSLSACVAENETICLDKTIDYYIVIAPADWNVTGDPIAVIYETMPLAKPILGISFVVMLVIGLVYLVFKVGFRV